MTLRTSFKIRAAALMLSLCAALFAAQPAHAQQIQFANPPQNQTVDIGQQVNIPVRITVTGRKRISLRGSGLPQGLSFPIVSGNGEATSTITGAPTQSGSFTIIFTASGQGGARGNTHTFQLTVRAIPTAGFGAAAYALAEGATLDIPVTLSRAGAAAVEIALAVSGTAAAADHAGVTGPLRINAGAVTANLHIAPVADNLVEHDETIAITLTPPAGYVAGSVTATTVTITDGDRSGATVAFGADAAASAVYTATAAEADGTLNVPVTISAPPGAATTFYVDDITAAGGASEGAGGDYTIASSQLEFPAEANEAARTQNLVITLQDDTLIEVDEEITLRLRAADDPADDLGDYYARNDAATARITVTSADIALPPRFTASPGRRAFTLSWTADPDPRNIAASGYLARWRQTVGGTPGNWENANGAAGADAGSQTSYEITGLTNGSTYEIQMASVTASGNSEWSQALRRVVFTLDVDGRASMTLHDGILLARYLFGVTGVALTDGASAAMAADIVSILDAAKTAGVLDVDGETGANWKDGVLYARYLAGLRGDVLVAGLGLATDAATVAANIAGNLPGP